MGEKPPIFNEKHQFYPVMTENLKGKRKKCEKKNICMWVITMT